MHVCKPVRQPLLSCTTAYFLAHSHICLILMYMRSLFVTCCSFIRTVLLQVPWDTGKAQPLVVEAFEKGLFTAPVQAPVYHSVGSHLLPS